MRQEGFVILIGVLLTVAAALAIGGVPFSGGGSDVIVSDTIAQVDAAASTSVAVSVASETTVPDVSIRERAVPNSSPTTITASGGSLAPTPPTTADTAAAGPIAATTATQPDDPGGSDDELRDRDTLLVAVANASGIDGVSASIVAELEAAGYIDVAEVAAVQPSSTSAIHFGPGLDRESFLVTADIAWDGVELLAMALAPEIEPPGQYDLLILVGTDRAEPALQP